MRNLTSRDRRTVLRALSLASVAAQVPADLAAEARAAGLICTDVCLPRATRGAHGLPEAPVGADVAMAGPGLPMDLRLQVLRADGAALTGAQVDIWHSDAAGRAHLRGTEQTDETGTATFSTIFPGGTGQIQYRILSECQGGRDGVIGFDDALCRAIHDDHAAYSAPSNLAANAAAARARLRMSAPDGGAEAALIIGILEADQSAGLLQRLLNSG